MKPDDVFNYGPRLRLRPTLAGVCGCLCDVRVPDVRSRSFAQAAHRQSLAVAKSPYAKRDQSFVDAISVWNEE